MPAPQSWMNIKQEPAGSPFDLAPLPNNKEWATVPYLVKIALMQFLWKMLGLQVKQIDLSL